MKTAVIFVAVLLALPALADWGFDPMVAFPAEDMWLESIDGGLVACGLGTCADTNTDATGETIWSAPLRAGWHSEGNCQVVVNGSPLAGAGLALKFNSPDLNGDLQVNLADISLFASDYFQAYNYRSDLYFDGNLNLLDFSVLIQGIGATCP